MTIHSFSDELQRTRPDYVVFRPSGRSDLADSANEHFLVFRRGDGTLAAIWTQSSFEGRHDQHIVFAESDRDGVKWSAPRLIAGGRSNPDTGENMCSWAFPLVSRSGRIYVLYIRHIGRNDIATHTTGIMTGICSDDNGASWSAPLPVPMPPTRWDSTDPTMPPSIIIWQKPLRFGDGHYLSGVTRWVSPSRYTVPPGSWINWHSVVDMIRFENIDDDVPPDRLRITLLTVGDRSLTFPVPAYPELSGLQEASLAELPDGRIMAVMRSVSGSPVYSVSADGGESWSKPEKLCYGDGLPAILHPLSPCPFYRIADGEFVLFIHNNDGSFGPWREHEGNCRRPVYLLYGKFNPDGRQPVDFSVPISWFDSDNVELNGRSDLALYSSLEWLDGRPVLWYPD
ncbi:MAG: sialidase family protein, partial [Victivallaceae bacterium]